MSKPVLLIRADNNELDAQALAELAIETLIDPYLTISIASDSAPAGELLATLLASAHSAPRQSWLIATSVNAINYWAKIIGRELLQQSIAAHPALKFAAIGEATAQVLREFGAQTVLLPGSADSQTLAQLLLTQEKSGVAIIPAGNIAMRNLPTTLLGAGWKISSGIVYETAQVKIAPASVKLIEENAIAAIVFRSPSAVRALTHFIPSPSTPLICAGQTTARALAAVGLLASAISSTPSSSQIAVTVANLLGR